MPGKISGNRSEVGAHPGQHAYLSRVREDFVSGVMTMAKIETAYARMLKGDVEYRFMIDKAFLPGWSSPR
jgi:D-arabinose 1-dehydrogenase-like Zn-dependent alcohol dehydrogenase